MGILSAFKSKTTAFKAALLTGMAMFKHSASEPDLYQHAPRESLRSRPRIPAAKQGKAGDKLARKAAKGQIGNPNGRVY